MEACQHLHLMEELDAIQPGLRRLAPYLIASGKRAPYAEYRVYSTRGVQCALSVCMYQPVVYVDSNVPTNAHPPHPRLFL